MSNPDSWIDERLKTREQIGYEKGYSQGYKDACNDMLARLDRMKDTTKACMEEVTKVEREELKGGKNGRIS